MRRTHGHNAGGVPTSEYSSWQHMRDRCLNTRNRRFAHYGGRGITICERWNSFESFLSDMGMKPTAKHSIERIDVNGGYEPGNCRWATRDEQSCNTTRSRRVLVNGQGMCLKEASKLLGIESNTVTTRLNNGWGWFWALYAPRPGRNAALTCRSGHPFSPENTHVRKSGERDCLTCGRERMREYSRARRALAEKGERR